MMDNFGGVDIYDINLPNKIHITSFTIGTYIMHTTILIQYVRHTNDIDHTKNDTKNIVYQLTSDNT